MTTKYASATEVPVDRTRAEIERTLTKYGASQFLFGWDERRAVLGFVLSNRNVRFLLPLPNPEDREFTKTPTGKSRTSAAAHTAYAQAVRSRWRALLLVIRAKLEAVESGIVTFDQEFLAHLVLPDGRTVGDTVGPRLTDALEGGGAPELLPPFPAPSNPDRGRSVSVMKLFPEASRHRA